MAIKSISILRKKINYAIQGVSTTVFLLLLPTIISANQIDGCYKLAAGSEVQLRSPAPGGGIVFAIPLTGSLIGKVDNSYALDIADDYQPGAFIRKLSFSKIIDDHKNGQIEAVGKVAVMFDNNNPVTEFNWRWNVVASSSSQAGITDRFTLEPIDSDNDGVVGHKVNLPTNYNVALKLNLESIGSDTNNVKGCHALNSESLFSLSVTSEFTLPSVMTGTLMSIGDGTYNIIPDPALATMYFRNVIGTDIPGTNKISVSGLFSYNDHPEQPIEWTWHTDSTPLWSQDNEVFRLASADSDNDGIPGVQIGGDYEMAAINIALDANLEAVEVKPNGQGLHQVGALDYDAGLVDLLVPENDNVTYPDFELKGTLRYPLGQDGNIADSGPFPVVVIVHGAHSLQSGCEEEGGPFDVDSYLGHNQLLEALARYGFVAISIYQENIDSPGKPSGSHAQIPTRMRLLIKHLDLLSDWNNNGGDPLDIFQGKLDLSNIGLVGHSQGGGAIELVEEANRNENLGYGINALVSFAQATSSNSTAILGMPQAPWLMIQASLDGDTAISSPKSYTNAVDRPYPVSLLWFYGGRHYGFNEKWIESSDFGLHITEGPFQFVDGNPLNWPPVLTDTICPTPASLAMDEQIAFDRHLQLAEAATVAHFRHYVVGDVDFKSVFSGEMPVYGTHNIDYYWSYDDPSSFIIDNFDTNDGTNISSHGAEVVSSSGFINLTEETNYAPAVGRFASNANNGVLVAEWASPQSIDWEISNSLRDVSAFEYVALSVSQIHDGEVLNLKDQEKDVEIKLTDEVGNTAVVSLYETQQGVPYPSEINTNNPNFTDDDLNTYKRSALSDVRLKLSAFGTTIDLTKIESVSVQFNGQGLMAIDQVRFTD